MARSIEQIQKSIVDTKNTYSVLSGINSTSKTAIWLLWTWVIATCMWALENLFDDHKAEVAKIIGDQKPHTPNWYAFKSKAFQFGDTLPPDTDVYPVIDVTKQVVANAAVIEFPGFLRIKVAKLSGGILAPLSAPEKAAYDAYMGRIKDAGVRLQLTSNNPDDFRLALGVYYDPLILNSAGARLDGTANTPVQDAVNNFLANLPFNGLFVLNYLIETLQAIDGVRIGEVLYCASRYGALPYTVITREYTPDAGYMILDAAFFLANTTYTAHGPI